MSKRVLYLPTTVRHDFFMGFLQYMRGCHNWRLGILCGRKAGKRYSELIKGEGKLFYIPDFSREMQWEESLGESDALFEMIEHCETASDTSVNRIILAGERDIGRAYSTEFYYWPSASLLRQSLADNQYPITVVARMFKFIDGVFAEFCPDLIITGASAPPLHFVACLVARKYNIPFLVSRRSKILSKRFYWTNDPEMFNVLSQKEFIARYNSGAQVSAFAMDHILSFEETPSPIHYIAENWQAFDSWNWLSRHKSFLYLAYLRAKYILTGSRGKPPKPVVPRVYEYYRTEIMKRRQEGYFKWFQTADLKSMRYIYYPLHKEPELNLNFLAPVWHDERHTVSLISSMLPARYKLLVREHRYNLGRRPTRYYQFLSRLPGVILVHPLDDQFKCIRCTDLVITNNGSTGWEGLLIHRPVITLNRTFYDPPGLARRVTDPSQLDKEIIQSLRSPAPFSREEYDRRLGLFIDAELATTIPEGDSDYGLSARMIQQFFNHNNGISSKS